MPRRFKVVLVEISNKQGQFPQILINAIVVAFKFTKIQRWEYKIAKPTATEWKEIKNDAAQRRAHMACSHAHTCLNNSTSFLAVTCPCKNQAGWPFWCPYRNVHFLLHITVYRLTNSGKHRSKLDLRLNTSFSKHFQVKTALRLSRIWTWKELNTTV